MRVPLCKKKKILKALKSKRQTLVKPTMISVTFKACNVAYNWVKADTIIFVFKDHAKKTVTVEAHPHLPMTMASVHPCR